MSEVAQARALAAGLPRLLLAAERLAHVVAAGVHGRRRAGAGEAFWQFRDFQEGDEARRIDWRRSASGNRLLLREREAQVPALCLVRLDDTKSMRFASKDGLPTKWERAALLLLALSCLLLEAGERVALAGVTAPMAGRAGLPKLAQALAAGGTAKAEPKARCVVFGDFLEPAPVFGTAPGGAVMQVLDPAECDFPYTGRVVFEGFGAPVEAARADGWAAAYKARLAAQKAAVVAAAQRSGQTPLFHRTDAPPAVALAALYQALRQV
ncbi:MAG: hypothetical protein B7Z75_08970 [Acidocella sp. 20-57-95]|nr:MAG: hypothetical protein B7Z75_08970 [Acidocella sp. 20-57-95]OYV62427.1 MAG: hypothetical protein B7Z71_01195 [Acidocella sp. 21-58-7]HQT64213.1 DUF58 domain-containing protein [Acidocella sp.]HQU03860.1 DUF58 domain-containing protein [Acidocella sp.]